MSQQLRQRQQRLLSGIRHLVLYVQQRTRARPFLSHVRLPKLALKQTRLGQYAESKSSDYVLLPRTEIVIHTSKQYSAKDYTEIEAL
jgi:hypothetical protein